MRLFLIVTIFFACVQIPSFAYELTSYAPISSISEYGRYPQISSLEKTILKRTYENDDINTRLTRLEQKTCSRTFQNADWAWRVDNINRHVNSSKLYNISTKKLNSIEKNILGETYPKEDIETRIARIEKELFGATQSGKLNQRYQNLLMAVSQDTNFATATTPKEELKSGLKNFFTQSVMTGYTPPIAPYGYNTPYGFNSNPIYRNNGYFPPHPSAKPNRFYPHSHPNYYPSNNIPRYTTVTNSTYTPACSCGVHILD